VALPEAREKRKRNFRWKRRKEDENPWSKRFEVLFELLLEA
jgi:hypothetical protein